MQELMEQIYSVLSVRGSTYFEDLERDEDGKAKIDDIKIVFNLPQILQITDNYARKDIPLTIDIWGRKNQTLDIESMVELIDGDLTGKMYRSDTLIFCVQKQNTWALNLKDEDKNIRRKQLNYTIRFFK